LAHGVQMQTFGDSAAAHCSTATAACWRAGRRSTTG
jgi:hypothetical protein